MPFLPIRSLRRLLISILKNQGTNQEQRLQSFEVETVSGSTPEVALELVRGCALEGTRGAACDALVTVNRRIAPATSLDIPYTLLGSAQNGVDYELLSGIVTIPSNAASVDIVIQPKVDLLIESNETIILTLAAGSSFTPDPDAQAVEITLKDLSDQDGDGIRNADEDLNMDDDWLTDDTDGDIDS